MNELRYTLITDGSSDTVLIPILTWVLIQQGITCPIQPEWADLRNYLCNSRKLQDRIPLALELYPCDLLFIHRDAEKESLENRRREILTAIKKFSDSSHVKIPQVCVVPVRMQESWLLFDENAIRLAAGNRSGKQPLPVPEITKIENIPEPKDLLHDCLRKASGFTGRRLDKFRPARSAHRIAALIDDFSPLRYLPAFNMLEHDVKEIVARLYAGNGMI